jgi:hypothetical protein
MAQSVYSSHDWRKNTASAVVMNADTLDKMMVNDCIVRFIDPTNLKETEVDLSRLVRVFVTNKEQNRKSVK